MKFISHGKRMRRMECSSLIFPAQRLKHAIENSLHRKYFHFFSLSLSSFCFSLVFSGNWETFFPAIIFCILSLQMILRQLTLFLLSHNFKIFIKSLSIREKNATTTETLLHQLFQFLKWGSWQLFQSPAFHRIGFQIKQTMMMKQLKMKLFLLSGNITPLQLPLFLSFSRVTMHKIFPRHLRCLILRLPINAAACKKLISN